MTAPSARPTRLLAIYATCTTLAALACAAGWLMSVRELERTASDRVTERSLVAPMPAPGGRSPLPNPGAGVVEGGPAGGPDGSPGSERPVTAGTTPATDRPGPGGTVPCPKCGSAVPVAPGAKPVKPTETAAKSTKKKTSKPGLDDDWPPGPIADLPGATSADKVFAFVSRLRSHLEGLPPDDFKARAQARELLGEALKEFKTDPKVHDLLLQLFTMEDEETVAEALGTQLQFLHLSPEDRLQFNATLDRLIESTDPVARRKGLRHLEYSQEREDLTRWTGILRTDFDASVRAVAAEHPLRQFPEAGDMLVQAARFDSDINVRLSAIRSLGETASPTEMEVLIGLMRNDPNESVQEEVLRAFSYGATPRDTAVKDLLLEVAEDPRRAPLIRARALEDLLWGHSGSFVEDAAKRNELEALHQRVMQEWASRGDGK